MGYRMLLKRYIRHLELVAGDSLIEKQGLEKVLSKRELAELRLLAAEVRREAYKGRAGGRERFGDSRERREGAASTKPWERSGDREP